MTALDQTWHPDHFFCTQCGCQFGEDGFQEKDGKPYCKEDYLAMFALKCKGCTTAITEGYISALNGQWHPQCFVCRVSSFESELRMRTAALRQTVGIVLFLWLVCFFLVWNWRVLLELNNPFHFSRPGPISLRYVIDDTHKRTAVRH